MFEFIKQLETKQPYYKLNFYEKKLFSKEFIYYYLFYVSIFIEK